MTLEFVCKFTDGGYDWIDPIEEYWVDGDILVVKSNGYIYDYALEEVENWTVRPLDIENAKPFGE